MVIQKFGLFGIHLKVEVLSKKKKKNSSPSKGGTDCSKGQFYHSFFKCMLPGKGSLVKLCS